MKKLSLLVVMLFSFVFIKAHHGPQFGNSSLNVKLWNNAGFNIIVDNQVYPKTSNFNLGVLSSGIHNIKVVRRIPNRYGNGGMKKILYNGTVRVPKNSKVFATVTPNRNINVKVVRNMRYRHNPHNHNNGQCNGCSQSQGWGGNQCGTVPNIMSNYDFDRLVNTVSNTTFDDDKLMVTQQALKYNMLSTEQVVMLMNQFTFDSNKLDFAKMAFHQTIDKHNYYMVNNGFTFSSSANELSNYVMQYSWC